AVVSLTLTPSLCGRYLRRHEVVEKPSRLGLALDRFHAGMLRGYTRALNFSLRHALMFSLTPLVLIFATYLLFG
ncbi:MAG: efflux RND transporter permease subunit, partial [Rhodanobacter sp.]